MDRTLVLLETVADGDWGKGALFYGHGFHSVADLFVEPAKHLREHTWRPQPAAGA